jgi:hypothetical protein
MSFPRVILGCILALLIMSIGGSWTMVIITATGAALLYPVYFSDRTPDYSALISFVLTLELLQGNRPGLLLAATTCYALILWLGERFATGLQELTRMVLSCCIGALLSSFILLPTGDALRMLVPIIIGHSVIFAFLSALQATRYRETRSLL